VLTLSRRIDKLGIAVLTVYALGSLFSVYTAVMNGGSGTVWQTGSVITFVCVLAMIALSYRGLEPSLLRTRLVAGLAIAGIGFLFRDLSLGYFDSWLMVAWIGVAIALSGFLVAPTLKRFRLYSWTFIAVALAYAIQAFAPISAVTHMFLLAASLAALAVVVVDKREVFSQGASRALAVAFVALAVSAMSLYISIPRIEELDIMLICVSLAKILFLAGALLYYRERTQDYSLDVHEILCEHCNKMTTNESHLCGKCGEPLGLMSLD